MTLCNFQEHIILQKM